MSEQELLFASSLKPTWRKKPFLQTEECETESDLDKGNVKFWIWYN